MTSLPLDFPASPVADRSRPMTAPRPRGRPSRDLVKLTVYLPPALSAEAHTEAQRRGVPLSHIVAEWAALGASERPQ